MKLRLAGKFRSGGFVLLLCCYRLGFAGVVLNTLYNQVPNLIQPVQLNIDSTILNLRDFFIDPSKIDSVTFAKCYNALWDKLENKVLIIAGSHLPPLSEMQLWSQGNAVSILLKRSQKKAYTFTIDPHGKTYQIVQLAGEMNDWNPKKSSFKLQDGIWKASVQLNPGVYQYQLVIDGKWQLDPGNMDSASNNNGGFNSVFKTGSNTLLSPVLITDKVTNGGFAFVAENAASNIFVYWQNIRIQSGIATKNGTSNSVSIPKEAHAIKRSFIRVFAYNEGGIGNDLLIPLEYGEAITDPKFLDRSDKQAMSIYSVFVDRFYDGDLSNDKPVVFDSLKKKANFYGGDLSGITQKIKDGYFDWLHVNTLWISPILQNPEGAYKEFPEPHDWYTGYHGYWPISLTKIDHRFGDDAAFKSLVDNAHLHNCNVLVDLVANHVHEECPIYKQHPDWATQLNLPDGRKNIRLWDEYRLTTWFDTFLPTWDFTNKAVIKLEVDSSLLWITKFGIDGFRHDATKHIATAFWRSLTYNIKNIEVAQQKPFYQIGETYGSKELIASYIGSGLLDGQFDFNLYFDARAAFLKDSTGFNKMAETLMQSLQFYGYHNLMGNITGNHDQPRIASLAGGGLTFDEDARKAGWDRDVTVGKDIAYDKVACLIAFVATIPGIPVIYYGDEIGMPGAGDPDNRRMMHFNNLSAKEVELKTMVSKLFGLRQQHMALTYGDFNLLQADQNILVYRRKFFNDEVVVVFNNSDRKRTIKAPCDLQHKIVTANFKSKFCTSVVAAIDTAPPPDSDNITFELAARSFEVFTIKEDK